MEPYYIDSIVERREVILSSTSENTEGGNQKYGIYGIYGISTKILYLAHRINLAESF